MVKILGRVEAETEYPGKFHLAGGIELAATESTHASKCLDIRDPIELSPLLSVTVSAIFEGS